MSVLVVHVPDLERIVYAADMLFVRILYYIVYGERMTTFAHNSHAHQKPELFQTIHFCSRFRLRMCRVDGDDDDFVFCACCVCVCVCISATTSISVTLVGTKLFVIYALNRGHRTHSHTQAHTRRASNSRIICSSDALGLFGFGSHVYVHAYVLALCVRSWIVPKFQSAVGAFFNSIRKSFSGLRTRADTNHMIHFNSMFIFNDFIRCLLNESRDISNTSVNISSLHELDTDQTFIGWTTPPLLCEVIQLDYTRV